MLLDIASSEPPWEDQNPFNPLDSVFEHTSFKALVKQEHIKQDNKKVSLSGNSDFDIRISKSLAIKALF